MKNYLAKDKKLGKVEILPWVEVMRSRQSIFMSQQKYVVDLLRETGKLACIPTSTPIDLNHKLGKANGDKVVYKEGYQKLVRMLICLAHTLPDIAFAVGVVNRFMHNPKEVHL